MANSKGGGGNVLFGTQAVAAAGTAEALVASTKSWYTSVTIVAYSTNTGRVFYGGSDVDSSTQVGLNPGDSVTFSSKPHGIDIGNVYLDVAVNGEGADFIAAY
jgi:hypothetical protein